MFITYNTWIINGFNLAVSGSFALFFAKEKHYECYTCAVTRDSTF